MFKVWKYWYKYKNDVMNTFLKNLNEEIERLKELKRNKNELIVAILMKNEKVLIRLNQEQLYNYGIGSDGQDIRPYYRPFTIKVKAEKDQITEHVTLYDEGDFYGGFKLETQSGESVLFTSSDSKTDDLVMKYGGRIFGLAPENFQHVRDFYVFKELIQLIKK